MVDVRPDPKPATEGGIGRPKPKHGKRWRKVASRTEWAAIVAAKYGPCRVCTRSYVRVSYHHLVPRSLGGDDVAENIVPLCGDGVTGCHGEIESRLPVAGKLLAANLTDGEYAYCVAKLGEGAMQRLFGVLA